MREQRSATQILFNLLPQQTVDLKGRVWKVDEWLDPLPVAVDPGTVRRRLLAAIDPWRRASQDAGLSQDLLGGADIEVVTLNLDRGVHVQKYPDRWVCKVCRRMAHTNSNICRCGAKNWGQFHFVGFHACGWVGEPVIPRCATHGDVRVNSPGSSSVKDLVFSCPECKTELGRGLGAGRPCPGCRQPGVSFNVHRAASVYTPHSFTMVNPPRPDQLRDLTAAGGASRCLEWLLSGMTAERPDESSRSRASWIEELVARGIPLEGAEAAVAAMALSGHSFAEEKSELDGVPLGRLEAARDDALDVALATHNGRRRASTLANVDPSSPLSPTYREKYPPGMRLAGLEEVELVDRFPILRGVFGYSRGMGDNQQNRLVSFRGRRGHRRVYADASETEALFFRLDPLAVASWLQQVKGWRLAEPCEDAAQARRALIASVDIPERGEDVPTPTLGSDVLTLIHTMSHRVVRQLAVLAGIDRESLAEYLVPRHLGFFVYAGSRGDFVLGGLQALFETELHVLLNRVVAAESRCPLDPGCAHGTGACLACIHLGEPSCTHYNRFLDRAVLFGAQGYLTGRGQ